MVLAAFAGCASPPDGVGDGGVDGNDAEAATAIDGGVADVSTMDADVSTRDVDASIDVFNETGAETATACGTGAACPSHQLCAYRPGCSATPVFYCGDNTCGDAIAIFYCGCDGVTFVSGCLHLDRPYAHPGPCEDAASTMDATGE